MVAFRYALASVSALVAGSLIPLLLSSDSRALPSAVEVSAPTEGPSVHHEVLPALALVTAALEVSPATAVPPPAPAARAPRAETDQFRNWSPAVATVPKDLGQMGPSLKLALDNARNADMAFCFRGLEPVQGEPHRIRSSNLMLYLESRQDVVDVVEARVAHPGDLPPAVVDCARDVLRGMEVKVFFAVPGTRYSYLYEIEA